MVIENYFYVLFLSFFFLKLVFIKCSR